MKKQGYNWSEKDCTVFLQGADCDKKAKFQGINETLGCHVTKTNRTQKQKCQI